MYMSVGKMGPRPYLREGFECYKFMLLGAIGYKSLTYIPIVNTDSL